MTPTTTRDAGRAFNALGIMRSIRDNPDLTSTQKALLWSAAMRADNDSARGREAGRVRASLELLAKDAGLASKSAERAFRTPGVLAYFARVDRSTRRVGLWFHLTTPDTESAVTPDTESGIALTPDSVSTTPDTESDHLPTHLPTSKPARPEPIEQQRQDTQPAQPQTRQETPPMDDATWLAAELNADPAACRAAIDRKRQQATDRGRPWLNVTRMVRHVIPLDEWRPMVEQHKPAPRRVTLHQCEQANRGDCPGPHSWEDPRNRYHCQGA